MNTVSLICRLTKAPEHLVTDNGTEITNLRVAINGRNNDSPVFADIKCFGKVAKAAGRYLETGQMIATQGRLAHAEWLAEDGTKRSRLYVIAERVEFLQRPRNSKEGASGPDTPQANENTPDQEVPATA